MTGYAYFSPKNVTPLNDKYYDTNWYPVYNYLRIFLVPNIVTYDEDIEIFEHILKKAASQNVYGDIIPLFVSDYQNQNEVDFEETFTKNYHYNIFMFKYKIIKLILEILPRGKFLVQRMVHTLAISIQKKYENNLLSKDDEFQIGFYILETFKACIHVGNQIGIKDKLASFVFDEFIFLDENCHFCCTRIIISAHKFAFYSKYHYDINDRIDYMKNANLLYKIVTKNLERINHLQNHAFL